jgi:glutaredoxin
MIKVYSKKNCPACDAVKSQLARNQVEFDEVMIDENPSARQFLLDSGYRTVPQVYSGESYLGSEFSTIQKFLVES